MRYLLTDCVHCKNTHDNSFPVVSILLLLAFNIVSPLVVDVPSLVVVIFSLYRLQYKNSFKLWPLKF